jgi:hypothetical protein
MTSKTAKEEMMQAHEALAKVFDAKWSNMPEWQAFRAIDRALLALDLAAAPKPGLPLLPLPKARINNGPVPYVTLAFNALTEGGKPLPTPKMIEYIGKHRDLGDIEKAKVNITSSLSKDERFKSVEWANGRAWWLVGKPVPKTDLENLLGERT